MNRTNIAAEVWWTQISTSRQLVSKVKEHMENEQSFVLHIPKQMPWKDKFYSRIEDTAGASRRPLKMRNSEERTKRILSWKSEQSDLTVGGFLLDNDLFSDAERCAYHPSKSYPDYIAGLQSPLLAQSFIWVTNITTQQDIINWTNFVARYNENAGDKRAVFILEYCGPEYTPPTEIPLVRYLVEAMDCRVFCLELASILANATQKEYQAELAFRVGNLDPEISATLLSMGMDFIEEPVQATMRLDHACYSDGTSYPPFGKSQIESIESAIWRANISMLFPILEQWRLALIAKYETELQAYLPVENTFGEKVEKPCDLELGVMYFMAQSNKAVRCINTFTEADYSTLKLCRKVRNLLAHNEPVTFDDVERVLQLKMPKK